VKQGGFALLGYDNPLGRYPAPVVPVGRLGDELVAVYAGDESPSYLTLEGDTQYLKFDARTLKHFVDFDPQLNQLFAISSNDVRRYLIKDEKKFFSKLLKQESFTYDNPFLSLSLAKATNDSKIIVWELTSCVLWMLGSTPELVDSWYQAQLRSLKDCLPHLVLVTIPYEWRDLPCLPKSWNKRQMVTISELEQQYRAERARIYSRSARTGFVFWALVFAFAWITPYFLEEYSDWFFILSGIVVTHVLFLSYQFYRESQGYMLRATSKIWGVFLISFAIQWAIGSLCFYLTRNFLWSSAPRTIFAFIIGGAVAAITTVLGTVPIPKGGITVATPRIRLAILLTRLDLVLRPYFSWAIECCIAEDFLACQEPNAWGLNLSPKVLGDRLRMLYEFYKDQIAEEQNDQSLIQDDVDSTPWGVFYLLVRHVGRRRLRKYLKNPPTLSNERDVRERS
jgi:hypothetical protein